MIVTSNLLRSVWPIVYSIYMRDFNRQLRNTVARLRADGESMQRIADRAGISRVYLYRVLSRQQSPSLDLALQIAKNLELEIFAK